MIEVKDEILNGEPLYRIVDKAGNILFDDLRIEMKTPVIQCGTPLNKALFNEIRGNILSISQYNTPNPIITESMNVINLENTVVSYEKGMRFLVDFGELEEVFTSNIVPQMSSASVNGFSTNALNLFDQNSNTAWTNSWTSNTDDWAYLNFPYYIKPSKIHINAYNEKSTTGYITINGILADGSEETLLSITNIAEKQRIDANYNITTNKFYVGIKVTATQSSSSTSLDIFEIEITEGEYSKLNSNLTSYLNVNNLGNVLITGDAISVGNKHEFVYDGTNFVSRKIT